MIEYFILSGDIFIPVGKLVLYLSLEQLHYEAARGLFEIATKRQAWVA